MNCTPPFFSYMEESMKDVAGRELAEGMKVATNIAGYTDHLIVCRVLGFTTQKVRVEYRTNSRTETCLKFPRQLCIIN